MSRSLIEFGNQSDLKGVRDDDIVYNFHSGQIEAMESEKRITAIISGTQGGKTSFGPLWLYKEIQTRGPGDYIVVAPTFPLLDLKALPEFLNYFETVMRVGVYKAHKKVFMLSDYGERKMFGDNHDIGVPTRIIFGHASEPDSLEAATAKGAWADEAGQNRFVLGSYEAIMRRLSLHQGRLLITTTPYNHGWLKTKIFEPWQKLKDKHPYIKVVNFESIMNPMFSMEEWERAKSDLPKWKFDMMYRGMFTRPAGMIYDIFDFDEDVVQPFNIPSHWQKYWGFDFGGVNTACIKYAINPDTEDLFAYAEYLDGGRTIEEHCRAILKEEPGGIVSFGGAPSEQQWRDEFSEHGIHIMQPKIREVEVGIARVYRKHKEGKIKVFSSCERYIEEKQSYSREVDDEGKPKEKIRNKNWYHIMDSERYVISSIEGMTSADWDALASQVEEMEGEEWQ